MKEERLAIRVGRANPDHHLWRNNGTWFAHYTVHGSDYTKRRVRVSLGTRDLATARRSRDRILQPALSGDSELRGVSSGEVVA
jgi:hypothetical protein